MSGSLYVPAASSTASSLVFANEIVYNGSGGTGLISVPLSSQQGWEIGVPNGVATVKATNKAGHLGIQLYFRFVKSKFTPLEETRIRAAVKRYASLQFEAKQLGQRGLYEQLSELLLVALREQQILACGFSLRVPRADVLRYKDKVELKIELCPLEQFPRAIPPEPAKKLALARSKRLFDAYYVLFHPATTASGQPEAKALSTADKIKKKDPILFGVFAHQPDVFYFIADWLDEHCDLTLDKMVTGLRTLEKDYALREVRLPTARDLEALRDEVLRRKEMLEKAGISNWRELEAQERAREKTTPKLSWWKRLFGGTKNP